MQKDFSIMKMISQQDSRIQEIESIIDYIGNSSRTTPELIRGQYISVKTPVDDWINWHKAIDPNGRIFKHGVISFGNGNIDPQRALAITQEILSTAYPEYPAYYAVHTNIPDRVHSHFLLNTSNIFTTKKWQQSPQELEEFKDIIDKIFKSQGIPLLKRYKTQKAYALPMNLNENLDSYMYFFDENDEPSSFSLKKQKKKRKKKPPKSKSPLLNTYYISNNIHPILQPLYECIHLQNNELSKGFVLETFDERGNK